mmetsp:Transcript_43430/g.108877  ORF Transcript_43430/g.108877 Transcript_43430/m.108877 type:complete len:222 (-) Transcript_43430:8-673(-)
MLIPMVPVDFLCPPPSSPSLDSETLSSDFLLHWLRPLLPLSLTEGVSCSACSCASCSHSANTAIPVCAATPWSASFFISPQMMRNLRLHSNASGPWTQPVVLCGEPDWSLPPQTSERPRRRGDPAGPGLSVIRTPGDLLGAGQPKLSVVEPLPKMPSPSGRAGACSGKTFERRGLIILGDPRGEVLLRLGEVPVRDRGGAWGTRDPREGEGGFPEGSILCR